MLLQHGDLDDAVDKLPRAGPRDDGPLEGAAHHAGPLRRDLHPLGADAHLNLRSAPLTVLDQQPQAHLVHKSARI